MFPYFSKVKVEDENTSTHQTLQGVCQNVPKSSDISGNPFDVREVILLKEMEKKRIREEIMKSGLRHCLHRRELEDEVIREMMDGEIGMARECEGGLLKGSWLHPEVKGYGFGERMTGFIRRNVENDGRMSVGDPTESTGGFGGYAFQNRQEAAAVNRIATELTKDLSEGQVISLVKTLNSGLSGLKRKFEAPITECVRKSEAPITECVRKSEEPITERVPDTPSVNLRKNIQRELNCSVCQVTATSEENLKAHLGGKKHKTKVKQIAVSTEAGKWRWVSH